MKFSDLLEKVSGVPKGTPKHLADQLVCKMFGVNFVPDRGYKIKFRFVRHKCMARLLSCLAEAAKSGIIARYRLDEAGCSFFLKGDADPFKIPTKWFKAADAGIWEVDTNVVPLVEGTDYVL